MQFKQHHKDPVKKNSVRYDEVVPTEGTAILGGLYVPKTTLLKLTGGSDKWPESFDLADVLKLGVSATQKKAA